HFNSSLQLFDLLFFTLLRTHSNQHLSKTIFSNEFTSIVRSFSKVFKLSSFICCINSPP
ncbi:unnamed protein product, partial [Musa textilis]